MGVPAWWDDHEELVLLTSWLAGAGYSAEQVAYAVEKPWKYSEEHAVAGWALAHQRQVETGPREERQHAGAHEVGDTGEPHVWACPHCGLRRTWDPDSDTLGPEQPAPEPVDGGQHGVTL